VTVIKAIVLFTRKLCESEMLSFKTYEELFKANGVELLRAYADTEEEIIEAAKDCEVVLDMLQPITANIINRLEKCRALVRSGIGVNNIDVEAATRRGIMVCNSPAHCVQEVAVLASAHIMNAVTKLSRYDNAVKQGRTEVFDSPRRLSELTVGFVGFGNIARHVAKIMLGCGCRVAAYDPFLPEEVFVRNSAKRCELNELFGDADVISLHVPLLPATKHIINKDALAKMKDGVIIVNTARGPLVCEADLIEAVKSGKVAAAGLDVFESEPVTKSNPGLAALPQIACTPHVGYRGVEAIRELEETVADMVVRIAGGKDPAHCVNIGNLKK